MTWSARHSELINPRVFFSGRFDAARENMSWQFHFALFILM